ncbi:HVO_0649 family zinc finger protein [Haloarchaeobius sp. HRN-SO-5]|uniref:HVO_0649 family zinc finger protein n=1 Tax=Haloarchaeobius sp. HRN-SO-5 TaxID=3446118 RepID=UPI003EBCA4C7
MTFHSIGTTPFERLGTHYEDVDVTCPDCGYVDEDASWKATTNGRRIDYTHLCPSCGSIRTRTVTCDD